jgi:ferrochelatase
MPRYVSEPAFQHGTPAQTGVLLLNLGTPDAATPSAVRRFLKQFLSDPRVVEIPRVAWLPILYGVILNLRPKQSAARYAQIWTDEGSPLRVHTERQTKMLRGYLGSRIKTPPAVEFGMRYGEPSIAAALARLKQQNCDRVLVVPLYPQYSASTTASALDAVFAACGGMRNVPALRIVKHFHDYPGYIRALAQSVRDHWMRTNFPDQLVISFHGVPRRALERGDPYHCECQKTGRLLAEELALKPDQYVVSFQSRFGRTKWLEPYTATVLQDLGRQKTPRVDVVCPGFVADCLETLEEVAIEGKALFLAAGGAEFHYIPCLNERDDWLHALTDLVLRNMLGWAGEPEVPHALKLSREHALALGARQ